ncbi:MAG TPA: metallophosphoesterase [Candidatus Obscuribacterales bacterium]
MQPDKATDVTRSGSPVERRKRFALALPCTLSISETAVFLTLASMFLAACAAALALRMGRLFVHFITSIHPDELVGFLSFIAVVALVYLSAAVFLIEMVVKRLRRQHVLRKGWSAWLRRSVLVLAATGVACMAYGYFVEPYWPDVTRTTVATPRLPAGSRPIRIVHISDLHCDPVPRLEERLPDLVKRQHPDLILFTGDAINSPAGLPVFRRCLTELSAIAPTYAVRGNWDAFYWNDLDLFGKTGALELKGEAISLTVNGNRLCVAGAPVGQPGAKEKALSAVPPGMLSIFLYHYPSAIVEAAQAKIDLLCAGHTHGGQVALPLYGALITLSKLGKQYEAGLYRLQDTWIYVTRGIGMEGGPAPRVRFCARPEISVIDLVPESARPR